jgi:drug/metabolite transporter (DMT)-like permease
MLALQAAVLVPVAVALDAFEAPRALFRPTDLALLGAGALTAAFYLGAFELQKRGGPVVVGQLGFVMTVASLAIGVAAFGERYPLTAFAAVAVVLAGVALVNRPVAPAPKGA